MFGPEKQSKKEALPAIAIEGFRVVLRPARLDDWPDWFEVRSKNINHLKPFEPRWASDSLTRGFFERRLARQARDWDAGFGNYFLIVKKENLKIVGGMNVNNITRGAAQYASLGYWIDKDHEGQGYMAESLRLIARYCFEELKLHRLHAATLLHNERSRRLLERCGFMEEGRAEKYLQIDGRWQDHILYGLTIEGWRKSEKS